MIQIKDKTKCTGCMACYNACPENCIEMYEDREGFWYPVIDNERCISCNKCEMVCPLITDVIPKEDYELCYTAYNKNMKDREISSSGGIFVAFAKQIINDGGIVFGAAFDEAYILKHDKAESEGEIIKLVGSKYLQSRIGYIYREIRRELLTNRRVLFVGTTCQVAGLKSFLEKEYPNLITVDFICLSIPSPKVWNDYVNAYYNREQIRFINFKDKSLGWHDFSLRIDNPEICVKRGRDTFFFIGYFKQLYSRPSCSNCFFKNKRRVSDITISDCWGYKHIAPEMDDNRGLSSIICHSKNGELLFDEVKDKLIWKKTNIRYVKRYNSNYIKSAPMSEQREEFWEEYDHLSKEALFEKYCKPEDYVANENIIRRIYSAINKIFDG